MIRSLCALVAALCLGTSVALAEGLHPDNTLLNLEIASTSTDTSGNAGIARIIATLHTFHGGRKVFLRFHKVGFEPGKPMYVNSPDVSRIELEYLAALIVGAGESQVAIEWLDLGPGDASTSEPPVPTNMWWHTGQTVKLADYQINESRYDMVKGRTVNGQCGRDVTYNFNFSVKYPGASFAYRFVRSDGTKMSWNSYEGMPGAFKALADRVVYPDPSAFAATVDPRYIRPTTVSESLEILDYGPQNYVRKGVGMLNPSASENGTIVSQIDHQLPPSPCRENKTSPARTR